MKVAGGRVPKGLEQGGIRGSNRVEGTGQSQGGKEGHEWSSSGYSPVSNPPLYRIFRAVFLASIYTAWLPLLNASCKHEWG